mgnify:CR=1 FL=1
MSKPAFTKGPWRVGDLDSNAQRIIHGEHYEICTCWHHCVVSIEREMEANATLIAAAPEMFEALTEACDLIKDLVFFANSNGGEYPFREFEEGRAALIKAVPSTGDGE